MKRRRREYVQQPHTIPFGSQQDIQRYRDAGHSDQWITWYMGLPYRRMSKQMEAKHFIISMSGPGADRLAKKYLQLRFWEHA